MPSKDYNETDLDNIDHVFRSVPETSFVCIEHPGIVKNNHRAINTLGGSYIVNKVCL